jgi:ppGpp synthetase/RelA/SpoT-type nucleotidyltranferase
MKAPEDYKTLRELSQLQGSAVRTLLDDQLKEIDRQLRYAVGEQYRVLQGHAQALEELGNLIDTADDQIKKIRARQEPQIQMRKAF